MAVLPSCAVKPMQERKKRRSEAALRWRGGQGLETAWEIVPIQHTWTWQQADPSGGTYWPASSPELSVPAQVLLCSGGGVAVGLLAVFCPGDDAAETEEYREGRTFPWDFFGASLMHSADHPAAASGGCWWLYQASLTIQCPENSETVFCKQRVGTSVGSYSETWHTGKRWLRILSGF